jgi:hypothetical protein
MLREYNFIIWNDASVRYNGKQYGLEKSFQRYQETWTSDYGYNLINSLNFENPCNHNAVHMQPTGALQHILLMHFVGKTSM